MKTEPRSLSRSYLAELRKHLKAGTRTSVTSARKLGMKAVALGLETLHIAKIHEEALILLASAQDSSRVRREVIRRAGIFFAEAITPIEEAHRGARESNVQLKQMIETLTLRTNELEVSNEELMLEINHRKAVEDDLRISEGTSSQLLSRSLQMQEEMRNLSRRLLSVQEEERKRISRELHDVIGQTLTGINVRLNSLKSQSTASSTELHREIGITQKLVEKSLEIVHRFARDLRPAALDDLGSIPALHSYFKTFMKETGIHVGFTAFAGVEALDTSKLTVLYRVAQESLNNILRHAKASRADVSISSLPAHVCMEIKDDGRGFKMNGHERAAKDERLGLLGMRERLEMVGGTFQVISSPGQGTTVHVEVPKAGSTLRESPSTRTKAPIPDRA
ncbi:MAG: sensor histidine kinase [Verrucomicrobiales bacterium]